MLNNFFFSFPIRFPTNHTIGVYVVSRPNGYAPCAWDAVIGSTNTILLTTIFDLEQILHQLPINPNAVDETTLQTKVEVLSKKIDRVYLQNERLLEIKTKKLKKKSKDRKLAKKLLAWAPFFFIFFLIISIDILFSRFGYYKGIYIFPFYLL